MPHRHARALRAALPCALAAFAPTTLAQTYQQFHGTPANELAYDLDATTDGGFITAGMYQTPEDSDFYVSKHGFNGNVQWTIRYGGKSPDRATSIQQTADGGYIVAGQTSSAESGFNLALLRLDQDGAPIWARAYEGGDFNNLITNPNEPSYDLQPAVIELTEGGFMACFAQRTPSDGLYNVLLRVNDNGSVVSNRVIRDAIRRADSYMALTDLHELADGAIATTGYWADYDSERGSISEVQALAAVFENNGTPRWANRYQQESRDQVADIGYGLAAEPDGKQLVIATHTLTTPDAGIPTQGTTHIALDTGDGAYLIGNTLDRLAPAFAATKRYSDGTYVTAGVDTTASQQSFGVGTGAVAMLDNQIEQLLAFNTYSVLSVNLAPERLEAFAETNCNTVFTGPKTTSFSAATEQMIIKTEPDLSSTCLTLPIPAELVKTSFITTAIDIEIDSRSASTSWGDFNELEFERRPICNDGTCSCAADINNDGVADLGDINTFIDFFLNGNIAADYNGDGFLDLGDINVFVAIFLQGC